MVATLVVFYVGIFWLDCVISLGWGLLLAAHQSNLPTLMSKHFNNDLEMFGVQQFIGAIVFAVLVLVLSLLVKFSSFATFSLLILIFGVVAKDSWTIMKKN